jgi:hypothetical protein
VLQLMKTELIINLKTAKVLGISAGYIASPC